MARVAQRGQAEEHGDQAREPGGQRGHRHLQGGVDHPGHHRPGDRSESDDGDHHQQHGRDLIVEVGGRQRALEGAEEGTADAGQRRRQGEHQHPQPVDVDADRVGGQFAPPHGGQVPAHGAVAHQLHDPGAHGQDDQRQQEERLGGGEAHRPGGRTGQRDPARPVADPGVGEQDVVGQEGEGQRGQRQRQAGQAEGGEGHHHAEAGGQQATRHHAEDDGETEVVGQLSGHEAAEPGEGGLAQGDLARHAGQEDQRQEDDRERHPLVHGEQPVGGHPGDGGHHGDHTHRPGERGRGTAGQDPGHPPGRTALEALVPQPHGVAGAPRGRHGGGRTGSPRWSARGPRSAGRTPTTGRRAAAAGPAAGRPAAPRRAARAAGRWR